MKILFDFYEISSGRGKSIGIYNYSLLLLKALASDNKHINVVVSCSGDNIKEISSIPNIEIKKISNSYPTFIQRILWRLYNAIRTSKAEKVDIYFSPKGFSPGLRKRKRKPFIIITVHDMIPFYYLDNYPKYFSKFENAFITKTLLNSIKIANKVITISEFSKQMIFKYSNNVQPVEVVYNGVSLPVLHKDKKENGLYIFGITSAFPHKNKEKLLGGYLEYRRSTLNPLPLILCGITADQTNLSQEEKKSIEFIKYAEPKKFISIFNNASLFLFLPLIEGFGFPPLEALTYKIPCVVSDIPVFREILGQAAFFVNPEDCTNIAYGIEKVLSTSSVSKRILLYGSNILSNYTWERCGQGTISVFKEVLKEN